MILIRQKLIINNTITNIPQEIPYTFNDYFLTVADTVSGNTKKITVILETTGILPNTGLSNLIPHF